MVSLRSGRLRRSRCYLLECEGLGLFFGGAHLPHAHHGACAARDDELGVGADRTENLAPFRQTLINGHRLQEKNGHETHRLSSGTPWSRPGVELGEGEVGSHGTSQEDTGSP